jgi:hypothetical protein
VAITVVLLGGTVALPLLPPLRYWAAASGLQSQGAAPEVATRDALQTENAVREALRRYSTALESLDANAVKKVQPSIAADKLARAFRDMRELKVVIDEVGVLSVDSGGVRVSCRVTQTITPRVGARQTTSVTRVVRLRQQMDTWVIAEFER